MPTHRKFLELRTALTQHGIDPLDYLDDLLDGMSPGPMRIGPAFYVVTDQFVRWISGRQADAIRHRLQVTGELPIDGLPDPFAASLGVAA